MNTYMPKIIEANPKAAGGNIYGEMLVELEKCHKCSKLMIVAPDNRWGTLFPKYWKLNFDSQIKAAGWARRSTVKVDNEYICEECVEARRADFKCSLCGERHLTDQIEESFGDPPEFLCKVCYGSVPAREWSEKAARLRAIHRYDFD